MRISDWSSDVCSSDLWWGLASLGTIRLRIDDVEAIRDSLAVPTDDLNRLLLHFALGRALGNGRCYDESFRHYAAANELRSKLIPYDPSHVEEMVRGARSVFTREFLHRRTAATAVAATAVAARPILIVGLQIGRARWRERGCQAGWIM